MNVNHSQVIRCGPRAGQPRPITDIVLDGLSAAKIVAIKLKRNGLTVIGATVDNGMPTVQVAACRLTAELVEHDAAAYYKHTTLGGVAERHGVFTAETDDGRKVRVLWVERGGH